MKKLIYWNEEKTDNVKMKKEEDKNAHKTLYLRIGRRSESYIYIYIYIFIISYVSSGYGWLPNLACNKHL
jgi:hypothetical protein